jgi:hypothetical protein
VCPQREAADLPETPSAFDIRRIEMRQNLVAARLEDRRGAIAHFTLLERRHAGDAVLLSSGASELILQIGSAPDLPSSARC